MRRNGIDGRAAETIWTQLSSFADYGFPESHAASFAHIVYASAHLKQHYAAEYLCAMLNNQPMGFYPPHVLTNDARRHGIRLLPPDFNRSEVRCTVEGSSVRVGLGYVADLGAVAAANLVADRAAHGPFRSLADVVRRVPLRVEAAENLVAVGGADGFGLGRREALWQLGLFLPARSFGGRDGKEPGRQLPLALPVDADMVELRPLGPWEQMATDYATMGLSPRYHPLGLLRTKLPQGIVPIAELASLPDGLRLRVAGLVVCRQRPGTAKGITFLLLEDEGGLVNVVVFPDLYEAERHVVRGEPFLLIEGVLQRRNNTINLVAERICPLDAARNHHQPPTGDRLPDGRSVDVIVARATRPATAAPGAGGPIDLDEAAVLRRLAPAAHNYR
jgi:error-prone DNA polymerase